MKIKEDGEEERQTESIHMYAECNTVEFNRYAVSCTLCAGIAIAAAMY